MIKYLGSKRLLLPHILDAVRAYPDARTVLDLFSGTSRVGHALKRAGYRVLANDALSFAHTIATCYIQADRDDTLPAAASLIAEFNAIPDDDCTPGWFTEAFCTQARYFHPRNGARIEMIRSAIAAKALGPELEAVLLTSLLEAADRVDCTAAVQMAYLKDYPPRAFNRLELRAPDLLPRAAAGKGQALCMDALDAAAALAQHGEADIAYIDPPYNQHSYLGNYHVWETLIRWDNPELYGLARKRIDCKTRKSPFNSRPRCAAALAALIDAVRARVLIVSFSDEGYLSREQLEAMLSERGRVRSLAIDYKRYIGAQIGIYSPAGTKVGAVSHLRNTEYIYILDRAAAPATLI
jgi:adenine-specific DNA-methyltransferase